jgi:FixJ family two-component response regulator
MIANGERTLAMTARERQVFEMIRAGQTNKEVAFELGIEATTVRVLRGRAMRKVGPSDCPAPPRPAFGA